MCRRVSGRVLFGIAAAAAIWSASASGQHSPSRADVGYPVKPVRYVVTFAAGAAPDMVARLLSDRLTRQWGQQVIVDNRVGVGGVMGTTSVAKSPADGYTLVQCNVGTSAIAMSLYAKVPYDQARDFAPVTRIGLTPNIIVSHPSAPFRSIRDMVAYARANPGKLSYAAGMVGTSPPLTLELLKLTEKVEIVHIPYKAGPQGISDIIGGQVPVGVYNVPSMVQHVQSGRVRALGVTSGRRTSQLPAAPTMVEQGFAALEVYSWYGVCAPGATPIMVLNKLNADVGAVLRTADVRQRLDELGVQAAPTSREEFDHFIRGEIARWGKVIRDAHIPLQ